MKRSIFTYIGMLVILIALVSPTLSQEEICQDLQGLHTKHGDTLIEFLSDAGEDCLNESQTLAPPVSTAEGEVIWSESGRGNIASSVSLDLSVGTYSLNLIQPPLEGGWGNVWFDEIISVPESCFPWTTYNWGPRISFPSDLPIEQDCRLFATLVIEHSNSNSSWEVSISKLSDAPPKTRKAQDWSATSRGRKHLPIDISFAPGIYRLNLSDHALGGEQGHIWITWGLDLTDRYSCFPAFILQHFPSQIRIEKNCRIHATLVANLYDDNKDKSWEVSITKLD